MFWTYQSLKKVGVGELWGGGARRVPVAHSLHSLWDDVVSVYDYTHHNMCIYLLAWPICF